jgi:hypothetical protein
MEPFTEEQKQQFEVERTMEDIIGEVERGEDGAGVEETKDYELGYSNYSLQSLMELGDRRLNPLERLQDALMRITDKRELTKYWRFITGNTNPGNMGLRRLRHDIESEYIRRNSNAD